MQIFYQKEQKFPITTRWRVSEKMGVIMNLLLIGFAMGCSTSEKYVDTQVIGKYEIDGFNNAVTLELRSDGNFVYQRELWSCMGGGEVQRIRGNFSVNRDELTLSPKYLANLSYFTFSDKNLKKDSMEYYSSDSTFLKKKFQIFKWDSLTYLLSEEYHSNWGFEEDANDFERFSDYYNSGYEPNQSSSYFVKRNGGYLPITKMNVAKLPIKYQSRFLTRPIVAEILEVDKIDVLGDSEKRQVVNRYKLNRGRRDGVMEKMVFYGDDGCCTIRITDTDDGISYGRIQLCFDYQAECGKGERVTTYLERQNGRLVDAREDKANR